MTYSVTISGGNSVSVSMTSLSYPVSITQLAGSEITAKVAEATAAKDAAETAQTTTQGLLNDFRSSYIGTYANDAAADASGYTITDGVFYLNSTTDTLRIRAGGQWNEAVLDSNGALLIVNNLSDLTSVPTARTNLGINTDNLPTILPTLNLDFANIPDIDSRLTFTRASTATYYDEFGVLQTAPVDELRFDYDPDTGESLGVLIEEQRTNLLTYSEQFDDAAWGAVRASVTANAITAPDGTLTADKLVEDTTASNSSYIVQNVTSTDTIHTFSFYAKAAERSLVMGQVSGSTNYTIGFDLASGTVVNTLIGGTTQATSATIKSVGGGWYFCEITQNAAAGTSIAGRIWLTDGTTATYTGDGTSGIYFWGAQLEAGSFPTSYIKTEASQVTRSADNLSITGTDFTDFYNQSEGTFVCSWLVKDTDSQTDVKHQIFSADSSGLPVISARVGYNSGRRLRYYAQDAGFTFEYVLQGSVTTATEGVFALSYSSASDFAVSEGGSAVLVDTTGSIEDFALTRLNIGNNSTHLNGHIKRLTYYPRRLTNAQLQALTEV